MSHDTPNSEISSPLRTLAWLSLAFDVATAVLFLLYIAFPYWGRDPHARYFIYIPPQLYAMALAGLTTILLNITGGLVGLFASLPRRQYIWALTFLVGFLLVIQGPILIGLTLHDSSTLSLSLTQVNLSIAASIVGLVLLPILSLVYAKWGISASREAH